MELINSSRAPALPLLVLDTRGEETLLVVVKASFDITPGKVSLAEEQDGIVLADDYHGEPGQSSIRHAGDGVLFKPSTDVVLIGSAHAPSGRPCTRLDVVLKVGKVAKTVRVFGDRRWGGDSCRRAPASRPRSSGCRWSTNGPSAARMRRSGNPSAATR